MHIYIFFFDSQNYKISYKGFNQQPVNVYKKDINYIIIFSVIKILLYYLCITQVLLRNICMNKP